jgi:hypothetical protein
MKKLLLFISILFLFSGCATNNYYTSVNKVKSVEQNRDTVIVKDILNFVRGYYPPAKTKFFIDTKFTPSTKEFAKIFELKFRSVGYGITYDIVFDDTSPSVPFAWKVDEISPTLVRATFNIDNANISRIYKLKNGRYIPVSPYTVRGLSSTAPYKRLSFMKPLGIATYSSKKKGLLMRIVASSLNVREKPSISSKILRQYRKGTRLRIAYKTTNKKTQRNWSKLKNFKGFVATEHIERARR